MVNFFFYSKYSISEESKVAELIWYTGHWIKLHCLQIVISPTPYNILYCLRAHSNNPKTHFSGIMDMIQGKTQTLPNHNCKFACSSRTTKMFMSNNHRRSSDNGQRNKAWDTWRGTRLTATPLSRYLRYINSFVLCRQRELEMSDELRFGDPSRLRLLLSELAYVCGQLTEKVERRLAD